MVTLESEQAFLGVDPNSLLAARYCVATAVTCFLWDGLLTFDQEVEYIWMRNKRNPTRILYLWFRYATVAGLLYSAYVSSGLHTNLSDNACKSSFAVIAVLGEVAIVAAHIYTVLRIMALWEYRRSTGIILTVASLMAFAGSCAAFAVGIHDMYHHAKYLSSLNVCIWDKAPTALVGVYTSMLALDLIAIGLLLANAVDQPYREHGEIISRLQRDGILFFMGIVGLAMAMLIGTAIGGPIEVYPITMLSWSFACIIAYRLVLRLESVKHLIPSRATIPIEYYEMPLRMHTPQMH